MFVSITPLELNAFLQLDMNFMKNVSIDIFQYTPVLTDKTFIYLCNLNMRTYTHTHTEFFH